MAVTKSLKSSSSNSIEAMVSEYDSLRSRKKVIEDRMKYLSEEIKKQAKENGVKDSNGSYFSNTPAFVFGAVAKKSVSFNQEKAIEFLKDKKYNECITTVEIINDKAVESRIEKGDISYDELESITDQKVSYSIDVKVKEEMPEVEQTSTSLAASKKKPKR